MLGRVQENPEFGVFCFKCCRTAEAYRIFMRRGDDVLDGGNNIEASPLRKLKRRYATYLPFVEAYATGYKKRRLGKESLL